MAKKKTEEREYADDILRETKSKWGNGWRLLSERQQHAELALCLTTRLIAQMDTRQYIKFFQDVAKEFTSIIYSE